MADFEAGKMHRPGRNQEDLSGRDVVPQMREGAMRDRHSCASDRGAT